MATRVPCGTFEREMLKHRLVAVGVAEGHIAEFNVAVKRLPVLAARLKGVAVFCYHLGSVGDVRLGLKQTCDTLDVHLRVDKT